MTTSRREFIVKSALTASGLAVGLDVFAREQLQRRVPAVKKWASPKISIFSKHLHWLGYREMAAAAAAMGFEGVDLTVRPAGHVLPERAKEDLPKAVDEIRKAGLRVDMITTAIGGANEPYAEEVLAVASGLGITNYRLGWLKYDTGLDVHQNLNEFRKTLHNLQVLNEKYKIHGDYQNHAGDGFGSAVLDLWYVLKDLDPQWIGCQYDIRHATVEGANSWPIGLELIKDYVKTINIKDYKWAFIDGKWRTENVPLGEGMVNFENYFALLKKNVGQTPVCLHCEYPLGGAESGASKLSVAPAAVLNTMKNDLVKLREWLT